MRPLADCPVIHWSSAPSMTMRERWESGVDPGSSRPGCVANSGSGMGSVSWPGFQELISSTPTTANTGRTVGPPIYAIWSFSADITTGSCTSMVGRSKMRPRGGQSSEDLTGVSTRRSGPGSIPDSKTWSDNEPWGKCPRLRSQVSPMSSFHNSGLVWMKAVIMSTQRWSSTTTTSTPFASSRSSAPRKVRFSPITTLGIS